MSEPAGRRYRRSAFLVLYWSGGDAVLLNANTLQRYRARPKMIALLSALGDWSSAEDLAASELALGAAEIEQLHRIGLLQADDDAADRGSAFFTWDPIELAVQRRTACGGPRLGRGEAPPPLTKPPPDEGRAIALPRPARRLPEPLTEVLARRRSVRTYAPRPLSLPELSTLLHHAARVVRVMIHQSRLGDEALRPFPTAGARSELEIYVLAGDVSGLEPGAYHYDAHRHRLLAIRRRDEHHARIVRSVHAATGGQLNRDPAAILLVTAVFERVLWKYHELGLSLIYKDVGCLFQTLYLVATAMGLAPCAVGAGDEAENSRWLNLDPLHESQVGCFLIGPGQRRTAPGNRRLGATFGRRHGT
ncbi:SagB/ThcOx family dehydrogenase [Sorangium sp. So ce1000]|uniref:SagB/ThcOx family dehydrogenase n=1 Tax=Sorangium sp. So ce1000 TaxID=3133325 RepID=UPI003F5D6337